VLDKSGLGGNRVNLYQCSAAEVNRFVEAVEKTVGYLQKLGPNPIRVKA